MAINCVGVLIQAADLLHVIQDISNLSITFGHLLSWHTTVGRERPASDTLLVVRQSVLAG